MSKYYRSYMQPPPPRKPWQVHPVWRGIGCIFILLLPLISYFAAVLIVRENIKRRWFQIPSEFMGSITIPHLGRFYYVDLFVAFILLAIGFGLLVTLYAILYRIIAPPFYGPLDAPPVRYRKKRR